MVLRWDRGFTREETVKFGAVGDVSKGEVDGRGDHDKNGLHRNVVRQVQVRLDRSLGQAEQEEWKLTR